MTLDIETAVQLAVTKAKLANGATPEWLLAQAETAGETAVIQAASHLVTAIPKRTGGVYQAWTDEEEAFVRQNLGHLSLEAIAQALGRTTAAIHIRAVRSGLGNTTVNEGEVSANTVATTLGLGCVKTVVKLIERRLLPARRLPTKRTWYGVRLYDLKQFVRNTDNWLTFDPHQVQDPALRRIIQAVFKYRGYDEWWRIGRVATYHGVSISVVGQHLRQEKVPGKQWGNWYMRRSDAIQARFTTGKGSATPRMWRDEIDAFVLLATAVGTPCLGIGCALGCSEKSVQTRLEQLRKRDMAASIQSLGLPICYRPEDGHLFADWREHAGRFPTLVRVSNRFRAGKPLTVTHRHIIARILYTWMRQFMRRPSRIWRYKTLTRERLREIEAELLGQGIDPFG